MKLVGVILFGVGMIIIGYGLGLDRVVFHPLDKMVLCIGAGLIGGLLLLLGLQCLESREN